MCSARSATFHPSHRTLLAHCASETVATRPLKASTSRAMTVRAVSRSSIGPLSDGYPRESNLAPWPRMRETVLVSGDELLVEEAVIEERARAVGDLDPAWVLTEVEPGPGFLDALAATTTLGLGDEQRVVVVRRAGAVDQASWDGLLAYVADQPEHVSLVIEGQGWVHSARARALGERVKAVGGRVRREELPPPPKRGDAVRQVAGRRGVHLDPAAARDLAEYPGDEVGNLRGVLDQLTSIHGEGARLGEDEVALQFQGARHGFQWDITDALDRG